MALEQEEAEYVFYIAGAAIISVRAKGDYDLWLLDYKSTNQAVIDWNNGEPVPTDAKGGRIRVNAEYTIETIANSQVNPGGEVHCISYDVMQNQLGYPYEDCLNSDVWSYAKLPATVAVSKDLWETIPENVRPLPSEMKRDYCLRVVARQAASGDVRYYLGFHVEVIAVATHPVVRFRDWKDMVLGAEEVDLSTDPFDPPSRGHTTIGTAGAPKPGDKGALFVAVDSFDKLPFLISPKVPFGGGIAVLPAVAASVGKTAAEMPAATPQEPPMVVVSAGRDDWLNAVRTKITDEETMSDKTSALKALLKLLDKYPNRDEIELISHATDRHVLAIGKWELDAHSLDTMPATLLDRLRGKTLRIVGCATARGNDGSGALCYLQQKLGMRVFGAKGLIGTPNLISTGTDPAQRAKALVEARCDTAVKDTGEYVVTEADLEHGGAGGVFTMHDRELVFGAPSALLPKINEAGGLLVRRRYFSYPGLLQLPSATRTFDVKGELDGHLRVDALFHGRLLRFVRTAPLIGHREYLFLVSDPSEQASFANAFDFQYQ